MPIYEHRRAYQPIDPTLRDNSWAQTEKRLTLSKLHAANSQSILVLCKRLRNFIHCFNLHHIAWRWTKFSFSLDTSRLSELIFIAATFFHFSPLDCESYKDDNERYRDGPEEVTVVGIHNRVTASRLDVFPGDVRRKPNLMGEFEF